MDHNKLWKVLKEMGIPDHLTYLLRNLYTDQEATDRTTNWFQVGKGICQGCLLLLCLFNLHAKYIMQNVRWMKHKLESRLIGEISITSDEHMTPTLMTESNEELNCLLMKVKEESESWLKTQHSEN